MFSFSKSARNRFLGICERITQGRLKVLTPEGDTHEFGGNPGPEAELHVRDWALMGRIATRGDIGLGEAYVDGQWDSPSIENLIQVASLNREEFGSLSRPNWTSQIILRLSDTVLRANTISGSQKNICAHYDVGNDFYRLWLDPSMTYSSALFDREGASLESAQARKYDRILDKFPQSGTLLEVGCGWGGFAERAANRDHMVTGITVSPSQKAYADARLGARAKIELLDYRKVAGRFDNVVSIEMIEAVGRRYWPGYFSMLKARLSEGGRALVQAILVDDAYADIYAKTSDYVRRHVFPGGYLPSDRQMVAQAEAVGLRIREKFNFGQSYAATCRQWAANLDRARPKIHALGHDESFCRAWHYYLSICAASFATRRNEVAQYEIVHAQG